MYTGALKGFVIEPHLVHDALHAGAVDVRRGGGGGQSQDGPPGTGVHVGGSSPSKVGQHQKAGGRILSVGALHTLVGLSFAEGLHAPLEQCSAGVGEGVGHILAGHYIRNHREEAFAHHRDVRDTVIDGRQAHL